MNIKPIILIFSIFILSSCGFKPILAKDSHGNTILSEVQLVQVEGTDQPRLERIISETIQHSSNPLYHLKIKVDQSLTAIGVQKDSSSTRYQLKVTFIYELLEIDTQNTIDNGELYLYSSYDIVSEDFQNYIAERYTSDNILKKLSEELKNRLILVLSSRS